MRSFDSLYGELIWQEFLLEIFCLTNLLTSFYTSHIISNLPLTYSSVGLNNSFDFTYPLIWYYLHQPTSITHNATFYYTTYIHTIFILTIFFTTLTHVCKDTPNFHPYFFIRLFPTKPVYISWWNKTKTTHFTDINS